MLKKVSLRLRNSRKTKKSATRPRPVRFLESLLSDYKDLRTWNRNIIVSHINPINVNNTCFYVIRFFCGVISIKKCFIWTQLQRCVSPDQVQMLSQSSKCSQGSVRVTGPGPAGTLPMHGLILVFPLTFNSHDPHFPSSHP